MTDKVESVLTPSRVLLARNVLIAVVIGVVGYFVIQVDEIIFKILGALCVLFLFQ